MAVKVRGAMDQLVTLKASHTAATTVDTAYLVNGRVGLAMNTALINAANIFIIGGLIEYATSDTSATWTAGDAIYWDNTAGKFTKTTTSNTKCGIAAEDKASTTATGFVLLIPTP